MQEVQTQVLNRVSAQLSEHFEHFVIAVVPGGGGDKLGAPEWYWSGNRCLLTGVLELAKSDIVSNLSNSARKNK